MSGGYGRSTSTQDHAQNRVAGRGATQTFEQKVQLKAPERNLKRSLTPFEECLPTGRSGLDEKSVEAATLLAPHDTCPAEKA